MTNLKRDCEVFTTNEDWKDCFLEQDEDKVYKIAEKIGGEVKLCYYFESPITYPTSSDGEFIGFLIKKDGEFLGEEEALEYGTWWKIAGDLLDDPMIKSCGCDGLMDANDTLRGLFGMSEIVGISDEFILKCLNASIDARNRYCCLNGAEKLPNVVLNDGLFMYDDLNER